MAKYRDGDPRQYVEGASYVDKYEITPIVDYTDLLDRFRNPPEGTYDKFEVTSETGDIQNIFNDYIGWLKEDSILVKFTHDQAARFSERPNFLAGHLYGNPFLAYIIMMINEFNHQSEMNRDLLVNTGVLVLTPKGIEKIYKILKMKERIETQEGKHALYREG